MKRIAVLLSTCALMLGAQAQSTVTVSGDIKLAVARGNNGTTPLDGTSAPGKLGMNDHFSTWGLHGREDMGGGLYAGFDLVSWFTPDTGTPGNPGSFFHAKSVVKVGGQFGELYFGRALTPVSFFALFFDPWYWDGSAAQLGWQIQQANYTSTAFLRTNNTVGYNSPSLGGLSFSMALSPSEKAAGGSNDFGASVKYDGGPLSIGIGYDQSHGVSDSPTKDHVVVAAGAYDFGVIRPMLTVASSKVNGRSYKAYGIAATAPLGPSGLLKASFGHLSDFNTATAVDESLKRFSLGYQHNLSKRTNLFGQVSQAKAQTRTATNTVEVGINHGF
jgi:predicted porin